MWRVCHSIVDEQKGTDTMVTIAELRESAEEISPGVVADRRYLHQNPELGFQEENTARFVAERLRSYNLDEVQTGIAKTGVVGILHGGKGPGKCGLLRADMDALPITELTDVPYKSQTPGTMHACGHDAHTAMLLGAARVLAERRADFAGTIKFVFQPSEEANGGGAQPMIDAGVLENPTVDAAFGIHVTPDVPAGQVGVRPGPAFAAADGAKVTIYGKGGHAARPQNAIDPIVIGAHCIVALQTVVSREADPLLPAVITVGTLHSGTVANVIPEEATFVATIRSIDEGTRQLLAQRIPAVCKGVAETFRTTADVEYVFGYPPLVNDDAMAALVREVAQEVVGPDRIADIPLVMGAEDMSYFINSVSGAFYRLGVGNKDAGITYALHNPRFDIDEDAFATGVAMHAAVALRFLGQ
jgi:amidohydrolase